MNLQHARGPSLSPYRIAALLLFLVALAVAVIARPQFAAAGVSGQQDAWAVHFGTHPGELFDPEGFGVDPVDGSVYILSNSADFSEVRVDKFSASGTFEGSAPISRTPEESGAEEIAGFVGIAVDHANQRFYVVRSELGLVTGHPAYELATKIQAFSTVPNAGHLEAVPSIALPAAGAPDEIIDPTELHVDPNDHELVLSGSTENGKAVLQRVSEAGAVGNRYEDDGTHLRSFFPGENSNFGFEVGSDGTTYIVAENQTGGQRIVEGFTLPPHFQPASGTLELKPLPGFLAAGAAEGWGEGAIGVAGHLLVRPLETTPDGLGPQVALATAPGGEETLFWKAGQGEEGVGQSVLIHGYSLQQKGTTAVYGEGPAKGECLIQTLSAGLAATTNGELVVLDQGPFLENTTEFPAYGLSLYRFGRGGTDCPGPAAAIALKSGGSDVGTVASGSSVTLDAAGSELGGRTVSELTWTIEGPVPTETIPVTPGADPLTEPVALETPHQFTTPGDYTVRLGIKTSGATPHGELVGNVFLAEPEKLEVTGQSAEPAPTVTAISPTHGPAAGGTVVTITGTNLTGVTEVKFGSTAATGLTHVGATEVKATSPAGTAGPPVDVTAIDGGGTSPTSSADKFTYDAIPTHSLTIVKSGSGSGTVSCNGVTCLSAYAVGTEVELTASPAAGSSFVGWQGGGCGGTAPCKVSLNADTAVTAVFSLAASGGGNSGSGGQSGSGASSTPVPVPVGSPSPGSGKKTAAQKAKEAEAKAIAKCKKLHGKAKVVACVKRARLLAQPKAKKHGAKGSH